MIFFYLSAVSMQMYTNFNQLDLSFLKCRFIVKVKEKP